MRAIIGLGNPGSEYDGTRHNTGFAVIDAICDRASARMRRGRGPWLAGTADGVLLIKPLTYMNNSGAAVGALLASAPFTRADILVVADDFHLPLGTLRLRPSGSAGGHNGLASIIDELASEEFPRLRCGIDSEERTGMPTAEFVLSPFSRAERETVQQMVADAADVAMRVARDGLQAGLAALSRRNV